MTDTLPVAVWQDLEHILEGLRDNLFILNDESPILADWLEEHMGSEADALTLQVLRSPHKAIIRVSEYIDYKEYHAEWAGDCENLCCYEQSLSEVVSAMRSHHGDASFGDAPRHDLELYGQCGQSYLASDWDDREDSFADLERYTLYLDIGTSGIIEYLPCLLAYVLLRISGKIGSLHPLVSKESV